jgi:hypothetical protein
VRCSWCVYDDSTGDVPATVKSVRKQNYSQ